MPTPKFFVVTDAGMSAAINGGGPTLGWRTIPGPWQNVLDLAAEYSLDPNIETWAHKTSAELTNLYGAPKTQQAGGITLDEIRRVVDEELDEQARGGADAD